MTPSSAMAMKSFFGLTQIAVIASNSSVPADANDSGAGEPAELGGRASGGRRAVCEASSVVWKGEVEGGKLKK